MTDTPKTLVIRGRSIRVDESGLACLNDIWGAAGYTKNRRPYDWQRLPGSNGKIERVLELITGKSRNYTKDDMRRVFRTKRGADGGTYADVRLALDYAEYLNPKLAIEVKEVFLRYQSGDVTLADEVLQRSSAEDNHWAGVRALGRAQRNSYTNILKGHGVEGRGYMECTEALYMHLLGGRSYELRQRMKLQPKANLREHLDTAGLAYVMAAEALAGERIEEEDRVGNADCAHATAVSASAIQRAVNDDRKDRQRRLVS